MYYPLYFKSNYSFFKSTISTSDLINFSLAHKLNYVSIIDDNLFGFMEIYEKAKKNNLKVFVGLEIKLNNYPLIIYARTYSDYKKLIKIYSLSTKKDLAISDLSTDLTYIIPYHSKNLIELFKGYNFYVGIKNLDEELSINNNKIYFPLIRSLNKEDAIYLNYLSLLENGDDVTKLKKGLNDYYIDDKPKVNEDSLNNTIKLISGKGIELLKEDNLLPIYDLMIDADSYLKSLSYKGLLKRLGLKNPEDIPREYLDRINKELLVIKKMNFSNYFLVVWDFIRHSKKEGILIGPGRGSAGGSLVCYSIGITEIDPLKYNLYFERFLNEDRITMPDIDTDIPDIYRDQVINYVKNKYGSDKVSGIVTISRMGGRQLIRLFGKMYNLPKKIIDRISKEIGDNLLKDAYQNSKLFKELINSSKELKNIYELALRLENFPHHTSIHAAGVIISSKNLIDVIPVIYDESLNLSAYTMNYLEKLGLLKIDFLGIRNLSLIMEMLKMIDKDINVYRLDFNNSKVYETFSKALTDGIFQFESEGMKTFLHNFKPRTYEDLILAIAIYRPGPMDMIPLLLKRRNKEEVIYPDKTLEPILKDTYGIMVYQEQVMLTSNVYAGFSLSEADILRRAMSKKKEEELNNLKELFIKGSIKNNHSKEDALKIFNLIKEFASYGFNKSHAATYSAISYTMAYLKTFYPLVFYKVLLDDNLKTDKLNKYIMEARGIGINIKGININYIDSKFIKANNSLYMPLTSVKGINSNLVKNINSNLLKDIYLSITHLKDIGFKKDDITKLIYLGFFDSFNYTRRSLIESLDSLLNYSDLSSKYSLIKDDIYKPKIKVLKEYDKIFLMEKENELYGFYLNESPTTYYQKFYKNIVNISSLNKYINSYVNIIVKVNYIKEVITKNGRKMAFIDAYDDDKISITVFPDKYKESNIKKEDIILVNAKVELRKGKINAILSSYKTLNPS